MNIVQKIKRVDTEIMGHYKNVPVDQIVIKRIRRISEDDLKKSIPVKDKKELILPSTN